MESDLEAPSFEKTMTQSMLQQCERVIIPVSFMRAHGHMVNRVISLIGTNGQTFDVAIKTYPPVRGRGQTEFRFFLGPGWKEFVHKSKFQVGDCILFKLVGNSCFHVLVSSKLQENAVVKTAPLSKCEKVNGPRHGHGKFGREDNGTILQSKAARLHQKITTNQATTKPKYPLNFSPDETCIQPGRGTAGDSMKEEDVIKHTLLPETDYVKYPGLDAAINLNSRFPRFISKLSKSSMCSHDIRLEVPLPFARKYGHRFQACVSLLGPNGQWRIVTIRILDSLNSTSPRVQFRHGWKAFSVENGFTEGDVLLFSLVEFSKFMVQVFPVAIQ